MLVFIRSYMQKHSRPPTVREIGDEFGISSTNGVRSHLSALVRKGAITITPRVSRGIKLTQNPEAFEYQI